MKTKQAHTPGPLEVMQNDPRLCVRGTEHLYSVVHRPIVSVVKTLAENLTLADATLYAAAPEMKAELELEEAWLYSLRAMLHRAPNSVIAQITRRAEACRATIEKSEPR